VTNKTTIVHHKGEKIPVRTRNISAFSLLICLLFNLKIIPRKTIGKNSQPTGMWPMFIKPNGESPTIIPNISGYILLLNSFSSIQKPKVAFSANPVAKTKK
jgi:hypothetical protein